MDKIVSAIKIVITYGGAEGGVTRMHLWGAGNDLVLDVGDSYIGVAL